METNNNPMTVKDVLADVVKVLGEISVPVTQLESIGIPVAKAINGIKLCLDAMEREEQKAAAPAPGEPMIELVPEQTEG